MSERNPSMPIRQERLSRRRALGAMSAGAGMAGLTAACGGAKKPGRSSGATAAQTGKPSYGGQLTLVGTEPATFDPAPKNSQFVTPLRLTNDTLLDFKAGPGVKYTDVILQPRLAERWEVPDPRTYIFHLRRGLKFAGLPPVNGRDLTPDDIKWTFEYLTRTGRLHDLPRAPVSDLYQGLESVEAPDQATVTFHFAQPFVPFLAYSALNFSSILAHEVFDEDGGFSKRAVGTGPWQINAGASVHGSHLVFDKNQTYFMQGRPYIDSIKWLYLLDDAAIIAAFKTKQMDKLDMSSFTPDTLRQVKQAVPDLVEDDYPNVNLYNIYMNAAKPPLDDVRVRKAISFAINRDEFIKTFADGKGEWALAASNPGLFSDEEVKQVVKYDLDQARRLLAEAGHTNGVDLTMFYATNQYGVQHRLKHELLQAQLKKAGINITLKGTDGATEGKLRRTGDYQISMTPHTGYAADLDSSLYAAYLPGASGNYSRTNDPQLTPLLVAERQEVDAGKQREIFRQAVRRINEVPWALSLLFSQTATIWHPRLQNFAPNLALTQMGDHLTESWLVK